MDKLRRCLTFITYRTCVYESFLTCICIMNVSLSRVHTHTFLLSKIIILNLHCSAPFLQHYVYLV